MCYADHSDESLANIALNYTFFDARLLHSQEDLGEVSSTSEDKVNVWIIDDEPIADNLLQICMPSTLDALQRCVILVAIDLASPWKILDSLRGWIAKVEAAVHKVAPDAVEQLRSRMQERFGATLSLKPGMLAKNIGLPLVVVGCKSDLFSNASSSVDAEMRVEFIQRHLRQVCFEHGATLVYASAKDDINCRLLFNTLIREIYKPKFDQSDDGDDRSSDEAPNILQPDAVFVPAGWDSTELIQGLSGSSTNGSKNAKGQSGVGVGLDMDTAYDEVIRPPKGRQAEADVGGEEKGEEALDEQSFYKRLLAKQAQLPDHAHLSSTDAASAALKVFNASATSADVTSSVQRGGRTLTASDLLSSTTTTDNGRGSFSSKIGNRLVSAKDAKENPELIANFFQSLLTRDKPNFSAGKTQK